MAGHRFPLRRCGARSPELPSKSFSIFALGVFATPGTISVANAQDEDGADKGLHIDEIIVTSRKREESVFDIPVAVTA
jgi:hypothetical protein